MKRIFSQFIERVRMFGSLIVSMLENLFRRYSIEKKIFVPPAITIALLFLTGVISFSGLTRQRILIDEIFDKRFKLYYQSSEIVTELNLIHTNMYKGIVWQLIGFDMGEVRTLLDAQIPLVDKEIVKIKKILESEALQPDERMVFASVLTNLEEYKMRANYAKESALEGNDITTASLILQMGDDQFNILYANLNELMKLQSDLSRESVVKSQNSFTNFTLFSVIFTLIAIVISIAMSIFISRLVVDPVKKIIGILQKSGDKKEDIRKLEQIKSSDEIGEFAHYFSGYISEIERTTGELVKARDQLWGEMQLAKKIQTALVPLNPVLSGYEVTAELLPAAQVGGDYYDIINVEGREWIVIGDVSGHGVPAGLVMMMLQTAIKTVLYQEPGIKPSLLLSKVNEVITSNIKALGEDKYITITILEKLDNGVFVYSGLHEDILVYRASSKTVETIKSAGMWLGIQSDIECYLSDEKFSLEAGDILFLYTDGITEAFDSERKIYSKERLIKLLEVNGMLSTDRIRDCVRGDLESFDKHDDTTMIIIKRNE